MLRRHTIDCAPALEVRIRIVFLKSTFRPCPVCDMPLIEHLQQDIEDIRVCFLDLVKQDHRIRIAPYLFRQLASLLISDVSRR